jgi:hypothetical protein
MYNWNMCNKLSLVGMQQTEKYKENFDVSSKGPSSGVTSEGNEIASTIMEIILNIRRLLIKHTYLALLETSC